MSDMEYNKGKLVPAEIDTEHFTEENWDDMFHEGFVNMAGELYTVEWIIQRGEIPECISVSQNEDGSIDFETYHYNGGGHWTEVVEHHLSHR